MNALHRIERYLDKHLIPFDLVAHPHSNTSLETARKARIPPGRIAKGVLIDGDGCRMVAMIPANREVRLGQLGHDNGMSFQLASESEVSGLFEGCEPGAIPGLPSAWGMEMIWDDELTKEPEIFLEAGDHERLIRVETRYLDRLYGDAPHCHFCGPL